MPASLTTSLLITDSLCLRLVDPKNLLVAVGNSLHHYQRNETTNNRRIYADILPEHIHGFLCVQASRADGHHHDDGVYRIVAFGGRHIVQLLLHSTAEANHIERICTPVRLNDRISSGHLCAATHGAELVLLTFHGVAVQLALNWSANRVNDSNARIVRTLECPDNATLYCSKVFRNNAGGIDLLESLTFLGGTAFGELIVWRMADDTTQAQQTFVLNRSSCHNGVIFSIDCDPAQRLLITTSDDRSVKVWQLSSSTSHCWTLSPLRTFFGHTGRVFRCHLLDNGHLLSAGEDGQLCLWHATSGTLLARQPMGAALWHIDYDPVTATAFVAAADGNCKPFCVAEYLKNRLEDDDDDHDERNVLAALQFRRDEHAAKVRFVGADALALVTNRNALMAALRTANGRDWFKIAVDNIPFAISLLEAHGNLIAVAGYETCRVYELSASEAQLPLRHHFANVTPAAMVQSAKFVGNHPANGRVELLLGDADGNAVLCRLDVEAAAPIRFRMFACREPWATVACRCSARLLLVGDRCGHLHLFETDGQEAHLRHTVRNVHNRLGCTTLTPVADDDDDSSFLCGGHETALKRIRVDSGEMRIHVQQTLAETPMRWVHSVHRRCAEKTSSNDDSIAIVGFESNRCIVWQPDHRQIVATIECGGGHRYADVRIGSASGAGEFVYLRRNGLHLRRFCALPSDVFGLLRAHRTGHWHQQHACNAVQVADFDAEKILISAGDDNLLMVHVLRPDGQSVHQMATLSCHVSSVKALHAQWTSDRMTLRCVSVGGRAQLCVTDVRRPTGGGRRLRCREVGTFMLHESDKERRRRDGNAQTIDSAAEARFMAVAPLDVGNYVVGCSDGWLRCFSVDGDAVQRLHGDGFERFVGYCVLQVQTTLQPDWLLASDEEDRQQRMLLVAGTKGLVEFLWWSPHGLAATAFAQLRHHESGVLALDSVRCTASESEPKTTNIFAVATGGDDESVVVSRFRLERSPAYGAPLVRDVRTVRLEAGVHTAQVNGVRFAGERALYTTGADQTVVRWMLETAEDGVGERWRPQRLGDGVAVAQVKGVQVWRQPVDDVDAVDRVLVFGYGVQLMRCER